MLESPLPTRRQGDIRLPSQAASDRDLRSVSRSRAVRFVAALATDNCWLDPGCPDPDPDPHKAGSGPSLSSPDRYPAYFQFSPVAHWAHFTATGWALFSRLDDASGSFRPLRGCPGHDPRFPAHLCFAGSHRDIFQPLHTHIPAVPGSSNAHAVEVVPVTSPARGWLPLVMPLQPTG